MSRQKLSIENPSLAAQWDYEKNQDLNPDDFTGGSGKKVWWKCGLGHSWEATILNRGNGRGCPYCSGRKVLMGFNDLPTINPSIAAEWDYTRNLGLKPENFTNCSNRSVWWKCNLGHSWRTNISNRTGGKGCPYCKGRKVKRGFNDLSTILPQIAVEWDYEKNGDLLPEQFTIGANKKVWWKCKHGHSWNALICSRKNHGCPYCNCNNILIPGVNDLLTVNPELAEEWDCEKNLPLHPGNVAGNSGKKAWWRCEKGHSWQAQILSRNYGCGCPYCSNQKVLKGYNDLHSVDPELSSQWDYKGNMPLLPDEVTKNSAKAVWWKCYQGHRWKAPIYSRSSGSGCPYCAGKLPIPGKTDLKTLRPEIASEWDYEKNGTLLPEQLTSQSMRNIWWRCEHGHSFKATVCNRYYGVGCPYCAGRRPIIGKTDLATVSPKWLQEWDYDKNSINKPEDYTCSSNTKIWWKCKRGHSWRVAISHRNIGSGCPYCKGKTPMRTRLVK